MRLMTSLCLMLMVGFGSCDKRRSPSLRNDSGKLEILFLGHDQEHHDAAAYLPALASPLATAGIAFTYSSNPDDLNAQNLAKYDGLLIYANHDEITPAQERALLDFVENGGGFIPVHCASFCFRNSPAYVELVGGQFLRHGVDSFATVIVNPEHKVVSTLEPFSTWDETYEHHLLADDITVLMERVDGQHREPWTWVKEHGKGRVFYTAYGHDERTWTNPGFHRLMKEGILWAVGDSARLKWERFSKELPTLRYRAETGIPNYEKRNPPPQYQEPLSPEASAKLIQVPVGFDLELFAAEPDIVNPIAMEWDERGRLWVVETVDYPNTVRDDKSAGDDRIKICEDTDQDGRADKFTVFAEGLNIPTSIVFTNGGIIVSQAPQFLFLKDVDGDDKADVREIVSDGWGTFDTHAGPSNLKYGFDNRIWGVVGYSGFDGTIAGEARKFSQGIYRFQPDGSGFEFMTRTSNNTWGLGFNENNDVFASTANNTHSVYMGIPDHALRHVQGLTIGGSEKIDGHYAMHPITDKVRQVDVFGGFTAAAGHHFYTAREYPEEFWNRIAFVCEPTGHVVHMARIEEDGAGFLEKDNWNLFASADEWVAPVDAKVGPDGAVWVLDWYNFIIQHNPTPTPERGGFAGANGKGNAYENPLRDRAHGRIWRVVNRMAARREPLTLGKDDPASLVDALQNDNLFWRMTAQRLLVERGDLAVLPALYDLVTNKNEAVNSFAAIHALWTIDGLGAVGRDEDATRIVTGALTHPAAGVRKAAIQILSERQWNEDVVLTSNVLYDPDANTRLAALISLSRMAPADTLGEILYRLSVDEAVRRDEWLSKAVYAAATHHRNGFLSAYLAANPDHHQLKGQEKRREAPLFDDGVWKQITLPQYIEAAGLDIDGVVWFRKEVDVADAGKKATLSLGPIDDSDVTYVNGVEVGGVKGKFNQNRIYELSEGVLKPGKNIIAIRVEDNGGGGGLYGRADELFLSVDGKRISLAGPWKYDVEKVFEAGRQRLFADHSIGRIFADHYLNTTALAPARTASTGARVVHIKVIKNEMKYDVKTFTVEAGEEVEIVFENPDFMQHNLLIAQVGALPVVGKAADKLAADPRGAEQQYVPDIPEVLYATKLVNPQETVRLVFEAPKTPGDYPFVCTFPGHWSIMNGTMRVVSKPPAF